MAAVYRARPPKLPERTAVASTIEARGPPVLSLFQMGSARRPPSNASYDCSSCAASGWPDWVKSAHRLSRHPAQGGQITFLSHWLIVELPEITGRYPVIVLPRRRLSCLTAVYADVF